MQIKCDFFQENIKSDACFRQSFKQFQIPLLFIAQPLLAKKNLKKNKAKVSSQTQARNENKK